MLESMPPSSAVDTNRRLCSHLNPQAMFVLQMCCTLPKCSVKLLTAEWVAAVKWYETHQCRVWFGYPVEVWGSMQEPGYSLIPLTAIKSRVIHKKMLVNFGRIIGEHCCSSCTIRK